MHYDNGLDLVSNRNVYQEYLLTGNVDQCAGLSNIPMSRADFYEILQPKSPGISRVSPGL
jgi:hypothetical protein